MIYKALPAAGGLGGVSPPLLAADEILRPGSPETACASASAALVHVQANRSGHLINASPVSYPLSSACETLAASPAARTGFVGNV